MCVCVWVGVGELDHLQTHRRVPNISTAPGVPGSAVVLRKSSRFTRVNCPYALYACTHTHARKQAQTHTPVGAPFDVLAKELNLGRLSFC